MHEYRITYLPDVPAMDRASIIAHKVEGWSADYAFFGHPTDRHMVTCLVPRALVRCVEWKRDAGASSDHLQTSGEDTAGGPWWVRYHNSDSTIGGSEGPYLSRDQATASGEALGSAGMIWSIQTAP